ncbi:hypothetical protein HTZ84_00560 [Haloterrigena sp. SYSU A558-1]|uniref:DUF8107 domain-containing protein n=1 Tax=Haloterrigena gelatinilytica TaxID=2741724 RepID=A0A8J8KD98_9EURY|nr:hypothetical protein [Haloterrigena gelatinilytica]NUB93280.1 hypothetical protein [Haloterrigena gelatinilytica]NUC70815.1 hypothetical protein [Haloterrigena gelatinilytica]
MSAGSDDERDGFEEGLESSRGDPRVLLALNAVLSTLFAVLIVWGASIVGTLEFGPATVVPAAIGLFVLALVMTRP